MRIHRGPQFGDAFRAAHVRVVHNASGHTHDEMRAEVMNTVGLHNPVAGELPLHAEVELLDHGVLNLVGDDVDAFDGAGAGEYETGKGIA